MLPSLIEFPWLMAGQVGASSAGVWLVNSAVPSRLLAWREMNIVGEAASRFGDISYTSFGDARREESLSCQCSKKKKGKKKPNSTFYYLVFQKWYEVHAEEVIL